MPSGGWHEADLSLGSFLGGMVWHDVDREGIRDTGEPPLGGVTVRLLDTGGKVLDLRSADGSGAYDGLSETWYLDPQTYLEIARESPGSDFGRPVPLQTFYEDFRTVEGITLPFRIDIQRYTRERALEIRTIETNVQSSR